MAENLLINGVTYNNVNSISVPNEHGEETFFYPDAVRYNAQELTDEQKAQARENIGAASSEEIANKTTIHTLTGYELYQQSFSTEGNGFLIGDIVVVTEDFNNDKGAVYNEGDMWEVKAVNNVQLVVNLKGKDGLSMHRCNIALSSGNAIVDYTDISNGGRAIQIGDLLLSPTGAIYEVQDIFDDNEQVGCAETGLSLKGSDGKTPVKGTDYFTSADIQEIVNAVYNKVADGNGVAY